MWAGNLVWMLFAELAHAFDDGFEVAAFRGEGIFDARRFLAKFFADDDAVLFEELQFFRERARADAGKRFEKSAEPLRAFQEVAHDEQRPGVADEVGRARDRARSAVHFLLFLRMKRHGLILTRRRVRVNTLQSKVKGIE